MPEERRERGQAALDAAAQGRARLKTALVQAAWAGVRKKASYIRAQFQRLRGRRGPKKAICAVAASMLTAIYHMLKAGTAYVDPGPDHGRKAAPTIRAKALVRRSSASDLRAEIKPVEPVSI